MTTGKAYAIFDCKQPLEAIKNELPTVKRLVEAPSELELNLMEAKLLRSNADDRLKTIIAKGIKAGCKYAIEATQPGAPNKVVAAELGQVVNQLYQTSLYSIEEPFIGDIVYEEGGKYVFRE